MENKLEKKELYFNPVFESLFSDNIDDPRYYQVYGGRGSGKSFVASIAIVEKTYSKHRHKILYLRQTMVSSEDSTLADIREAIKILGKTADFKEKSGVITNKRTGSTISFKGIKSSGNHTAKLKSLSGITTLVIEEAEEVSSFEEFSKIDESIRIKGKPLKVILLYNPTSAVASWIHKEWFVDGRPMESRLDDTMFLHSTYKDNIDNLSPSIVKRYEQLSVSNPIYYKNTILAEWTLEAEGRIYAGWKEYDSMEEEGDVWYGLDFGYGGKDKTSLIKINYYDKEYYVEEIFSENKLSISQTLNRMRRHRIPFTAKIFADSAVPTLVTEIRNGGYRQIRNAQKGNVEQAIKKVQDKPITLVGDDTTGLYFAYMTFRRDANNKLPHEPDELAALRYGILSKKGIDNPGRTKRRPASRIRQRRGDFI